MKFQNKVKVMRTKNCQQTVPIGLECDGSATLNRIPFLFVVVNKANFDSV